ncbi:ABC transporter permease [Ferruginivarius sediminum]|uniref:ABC transporter permease n=1 Tax=Ferruginivarius sediminum TaxID=2661937 RepID=A0A369T6X5_9PROT|nr:ABC transporter permease [Ferruginivarius sediminum]RDD61081.1 ABC transporter permease [Ferruginivarius sediminum]
MHRFKFVLYRPIQLLPVLIGVSIVTFILVQLIPGDPARILLGAKATPEAIAEVREKFGLDQPLVLQYVHFMKNLLQGELGRSIIYRAPVLSVVEQRVAPTLFLLIYGVVLSVLLAVPLALAAAWRAGSSVDQAVRVFSTAGIGLPAFWLGIMLMLLFSIELRLFPVSGYGEGALSHLHHLFLPALTISIALAPVLVRNLRATLLAQLESDYVSAERAKGLPERAIYLGHVFRNSLIPTVNLLGVNVSWLIGGTVVIESVYSVPGLGQLMVSSIFGRDYLVVQAVTLMFAIGVILVNFFVDIVTVALDPRVEM